MQLQKPIWTLGITAVLCCATTISAQSMVAASEAELSIPFDSRDGFLAVVGEHLVFVDEDEREQSFALERTNITDLTGEGDRVTLTVRERVRQSGEFTFELEDGEDVEAVLDWYLSPPPSNLSTNNSPVGTRVANSGSQSQSTAVEDDTIIGRYQVQHRHLFGECEGTLIISQNEVRYESISDISHSRRWAMSDFKELSHPNPYELELDVFSGSDYNFRFVGGSGISSSDYRELAQRVTSARR